MSQIYTVKLIKALLAFAHKDEAFGHLCGLTFKGESAYATNGTSAVRYTDKYGSIESPEFVETEVLLSACRAAGAGGLLEVKTGEIVASTKRMAFSKFPTKNDWPVFQDHERIIPEKRLELAWPMFDPNLLAPMGPLCDAINDHGGFVLTTMTGNLEALRFDMDSTGDDKVAATVVIMPKARTRDRVKAYAAGVSK